MNGKPIGVLDKLGLRIRLFQLKNVPRFTPGKIRINGWNLEYVDSMSLYSSIDLLVLKRINDFQSASQSPVILDCGANIGISVLNYRRAYPGSKIIAFEPDPAIVPILKKNLVNNGASDVEVVEAAVWKSSGKALFFCEGADGSRIIQEGDSPGIEIPTVNLADYLSQPVDLVKMDIEGAEFEVIPGLKDKLPNILNLLVECHVNTGEAGKLSFMLKTLSDAGFLVAISVISKWSDLISKPVRIPNGFDQYILISAWRE